MHVPQSSEPVSIPGSRVRVALGAGNLRHVGTIARDLGAKRVLLVSDPGIVAAGHTERAMRALRTCAALAGSNVVRYGFASGRRSA